MEQDRPQLSVVIPTVRGWPQVISLDPLIPQAEKLGAEIIVVDSSGREPRRDLPPFVRWEVKPTDWSVFQLRAWGYGDARGDIVAVTEDHCIPHDNWCEQILASHREYPDALAIGGAIENGADKRVIDWAAFLVTQSPFMPPFRNGPAPVITGPANVSYKRAALEHFVAAEGEGVIDFMRLNSDAGDGALVADDRIRVKHEISFGLRRTMQAEFDNGRTVAGYARQSMGAKDWVRLAAMPVMPFYRALRTIRRAYPKEMSRSTLLRAAPVVAWFELCTAVGQVVGYAAGPGDSPRRLY